MTIGNASMQGIQNAEVQLDRTAAAIASPGQGVSQVADSVSISERAVALLQARNEVSVNVSAFRAADNVTKALLKIVG
jgi:hypothetical protein